MTTKNFQTEYININGLSQYMLHYPKEGSKDVLLMLHGGPGAPNSYISYYLEPYLNFCHVVYYDQRGSGKTQIKSKTKLKHHTWKLMIEDLRETVRHLKRKYKTDRVILCGHSFGSMLGASFLEKYPEEVLASIAYGVVTDVNAQDQHFYTTLKSNVLKNGSKKDIKKLNTVNPSFPSVNREEFTKGVNVLSELQLKYGYYYNDYMAIFKKSPILGFKDFLQFPKGAKYDSKLIAEVEYQYDITHMTTYQVPVFYILGEKDDWTSSVIAKKYFDTINAPVKDLYWISNAGHFVDTDQPQEFSEAIKDILTQI
ncbi:alpha/beta hydrolase [Enterococcus sp. DIV1298c]|uniref:alpha/beta fold hydrolase n=1 Tax=Enterococcus sp. DIV1298c TaxID=2815328 RepID=UPI001A92065B|nr:alpha/beta hydrolase [Enterococcus sp. DIV1298c]MBO0462553.1 alpha/beta hydrolase [Enterococcus sp. DIV1298c]